MSTVAGSSDARATGVGAATAVLAKIDAPLRRLEAVSSVVAGAAIVAIMLVVVVDVALRYLFNSPLSWAFDLISLYLVGLAFYFAIADTLRRNHHVAVDILFNRLPTRLRHFVKMAGWALAALLFLLIFQLAWAGAVSRFQSGDVVAGAIAWPTWVPYAIACFGSGLMILRLAVGVIALAVSVATGERSVARIGSEERDDSVLEV